MTNQQLFSLYKAKFGSMLFFGILFASFSFFGLLVIEKPYQSSMDFLVVQTNGQEQDFYTQFKSSEYLGKVLGEAVYSERFIIAMVEAGKVTKEFLPADKKERLKIWRKMVSVKKNAELGIMSITVRHERERDASRIMNGIAEVLTEKNSLFRGGDENSIEIRVLSGPINGKNPTFGKIVKIVLAGFMAGFFLRAVRIVLQGERILKRRALMSTLTAKDILP